MSEHAETEPALGCIGPVDSRALLRGSNHLREPMATRRLVYRALDDVL